MRIVNRILALLVSLAVIVATVCVLLVAAAHVSPASLSPTPWFQTQLNQFTSLGPSAWDRTVGIASGMLLLGLIVFFLNLIPPRREVRYVETPVATSGDTVTTERAYDDTGTVSTEPVETERERIITRESGRRSHA